MQLLFNQFMHIYFWVFLIITICAIIINYNREEPKYAKGINFWSIVSIVIWIMSFKY